ncbi:hypothetical protein, variant [Verruconis gallopava]|uniref:Major facilitator superfamily (MFS) profile domain-containing protein n=1 Tax=Verruconis gallopava TaxID=253628 RepID=A0A0D1XT70_9PEZI|nr:hypothetical protein, variant [Verruconis gallopava]KIW05911.1 hypothetical protein, variant [Verruconis gallopava]
MLLKNWSAWRKTVQMTLLSLYAIMVYGFLTVSPPLWADMNSELGFSYSTLNNSYGVSAATLSIGCIVFTPFAMRYGRRPVYIITSLIIFGMDIWSARMQNVPDLMLSNVFMGLAGSVNESLFQMTVNDLFFVHQRGSLNGLLFFCSTIGNYLAPVAGGYIAISSQGWRWSFWYLAIFQGIISVLLIFFLEETQYVPDDGINAQVPSGRNASIDASAEEKSAKEKQDEIDEGIVLEIGSNKITSRRRLVEIDTTIPMRSRGRRYAMYTLTSVSHYSWARHLYQPFALLYYFPAVAFAALQWAFCLAALSIVAVSTSNIYPYAPYNFSAADVGNLNIAPAIGSIIGVAWGGPIVDWAIVRLARRNGGLYEPEMRLVLFILPGTLMPVGVFMYGLCTAEGMHWIIPTIGSALIGFGIGGTGDIALTYLQDAYELVLPDALIGVAFVRNIMATILVFAIGPWFDGMGVYNSFVLLGCLSVAFSLLAVPMFFFGKKARIRRKNEYEYYAQKMFVVKRG